MIVILGLLMFLPTAVLGPIAEHLARLRVAMRTEIVRAIVFTAATMLLFGGVFPGLLWGIGRVAFPAQADGSLIRRADGTIVGSRLIAQRFTRAEYFHPRPSAVGYDAASTGGSNLATTNPDQARLVRERLDAVRVRDGVGASAGAVELVTASGSGLDPHLTLPAIASRRRGWRRREASAPTACTRWSRPASKRRLGPVRPRPRQRAPQPGSGRRFRHRLRRRQPESPPMSARGSQTSLWNPAIVRQAIVDAFWKLDPRVQFRNPVMFSSRPAAR